MPVRAHSLFRLLFSLVVLLGLLVTPAAPVMAQDIITGATTASAHRPPIGTILEGGRWRFRQDFTSNLDGTLFIEEGLFLWNGFDFIPQGPINQWSFPVPCWAEQGEVPIVNGYAHFNGKAYVACEFDLAGAFEAAGIRDIQDKLFHTIFTMDAAMLGSSSIAVVGPLFFHPEVNFSMQGEKGERTLYTEFNGYQDTSAVFNAPNGTSPLLSSRLDCLLNDKCQIAHFINGVSLSNSRIFETPEGGITISTASTTVYIGYNPTTGEVFNGQLDWLEVDPPKATALCC